MTSIIFSLSCESITFVERIQHHDLNRSLMAEIEVL